MKRINDTDLLGRLQPHVDNREFDYDFMTDDTIRFQTQIYVTDNWLHVRYDKNRLCQNWWSKYFGVFRCIPQKCRNHCFKAVAAHRGFDEERQYYKQLSLSEVMDIHELQCQIGMIAKCGMDERDYTPTIWGAYWYCDSLEQAEDLYPVLREGLDEINPEIVLDIKRGCTEFELYHGPSNTWEEKAEKYAETEAALDKWVSTMPNFDVERQHELIQQTIKIRFLHWAYMHGDMTYKEFIEGEDLIYKFKDYTEVPLRPSVKYNPA
jgi:hypothetical protein